MIRILSLLLLTSCINRLPSEIADKAGPEESQELSEDQKQIIKDCFANPSNENVQLLLDQGISPDYCYEGTPILISAIKNNKIESVRLLLNNGANVNIFAESEKFKTPLNTALNCNNNSVNEIATLLLEQEGIDVDLRSEEEGFTPLMYAIKNGEVSPQIVKIILDKGPDINCVIGGVSNNTTSALHLALNNNIVKQIKSEKVVGMLLEYGADVNKIVGKNNFLQHACSRLIRGTSDRENVNIFNMILYKTDNVNYIYNIDSDCGSALSRLVTGLCGLEMKDKIDNFKISIYKLLEKENIDVNIKGRFDETPLMMLVVKGEEELVERLLEKGADISIKDKEGRTAKDFAIGGMSAASGDGENIDMETFGRYSKIEQMLSAIEMSLRQK